MNSSTASWVHRCSVAIAIFLFSDPVSWAEYPLSDAWHRTEDGQWVLGRVPSEAEQATRRKIRTEIMNRGAERLKSLIEIEQSNDPAELVDGRAVISTLSEMEERGLMTAALEEVPWSDDYWPVYRGGVGYRYADPNIPQTTDWKEIKDYIAANPVSAIVARGQTEELRNLSPSEKYSLWVGDASDRLTTKAWQEGQWAYNHEGKVETWMGLCHGWAPAAFMEKRPRHKIAVPAANGAFQVEFFPADIKALTTLLWAKADAETRFIGQRCNDSQPERDDLGRVKDPACADINAGAWHLAVVSQVGGARRSMIIDATFDYEVWNQPVYSYSYTYFNPRTRRPASSLNEAKVALTDWSEDPYRRYRASQARYVVGISMELTYGVETAPVQSEDETGFEEGTRTVRYAYDVELDEFGRIVGGEWHQRQHPDFLWVPTPTATPVTYGDIIIERGGGAPRLDLGELLSTPWRTAAAESARRSQPMLKLVRALIDRSRD
jgi:hypothetical protein